jgi:hypothetical protein
MFKQLQSDFTNFHQPSLIYYFHVQNVSNYVFEVLDSVGITPFSNKLYCLFLTSLILQLELCLTQV